MVLYILKAVYGPVHPDSCLWSCTSWQLSMVLYILTAVYGPVHPDSCLWSCTFWQLSKVLYILTAVYGPVHSDSCLWSCTFWQLSMVLYTKHHELHVCFVNINMLFRFYLSIQCERNEWGKIEVIFLFSCCSEAVHCSLYFQFRPHFSYRTTFFFIQNFHWHFVYDALVLKLLQTNTLGLTGHISPPHWQPVLHETLHCTSFLPH